MDTYEYKVLLSPFGLLQMKEKRLNAEGEQGWRLITIIADGEGGFCFYFERVTRRGRG